jgi:DNA-binding NtrC family response regulator
LKQLLWVLAPCQTSFTDGISRLAAEFAVSTAASLADALAQLRRTVVDIVLVSLPQGGWDSNAIGQQFAAIDPALPVVLCGPKGFVNSGADGAQSAIHYIEEPATPEKLRQVLASVSRPHAAEQWKSLLVGDSLAMQEVREIIALVGSRRSTILITGETGTGKEIAARAIHKASGRAHLPMVAINCAALPENLLEAELFGHTRGAFTGAVNARVGLFEQAHRGTIFLDEIGDMPLPLQAKLLRVLQEREIQRIGSSETVRLDVRVMAATNGNLSAAVAEKRFRQDLFYRLNVVPLKMPALRDRIDDIPVLVEHFIRKICDLERTAAKQVTPEAMDYLMSYSWPGNVRQLEHGVESAIALSGARSLLYPSDFSLPSDLAALDRGILSEIDLPESGIDFEVLMASIEKTILERALLKSRGNKARAADLLNLKRTTLVSKFKALQSCA